MLWRRRKFLASVTVLLAACVRRGGSAREPAGEQRVRLRTPLCRALGIEYPIFNVGFAASAGPELAAAVSAAGGCGVLGGSSLPPDELRRRIRRVRQQTDRPFGVNVIIAGLEGPDVGYSALVRDRVAAAIEERVPLIVLFWGDPASFVEEAHRNGVKLFVQVGSLAEARSAAAAGVDAVIAQGVEAGGHVRGTTSVWELLKAVVAELRPMPVLASGGVGDGAGIARALQLGGQGVSLGTRFVASEEAWIHHAYKERVARSRAEDTFYGNLFDVGWPDAPHRALRNRVFQEWDAAGRPPSGKRPGEGTPIGRVRHRWGQEEVWMRYQPRMLVPEFDGDPELAPMWAGESCSVVNDVRPAGEIVRELARQAQEVLARGA